LIAFLGKYGIDLTDEEIELMFKQNGKVNIHGERMIWFRKLILDSVCKFLGNYSIARSNALISFKINVQRRGSVKTQHLKQFTLVADRNDDLNSNKEIDDDLETSYYDSSEAESQEQDLRGIPEEEEAPESPMAFLNRMRNKNSTKHLNNLVQQLLNNRHSGNLLEKRKPVFILPEEKLAVKKEPILT
jgi:hypothetical protein